MSDVAPQVRQGTRDPVHGRHATLWWRGVTHETEWRRMARISTTVTTITNTTYNSSRRYQVDQVSLWCLIPDVHLRQDTPASLPPLQEPPATQAHTGSRHTLQEPRYRPHPPPPATQAHTSSSHILQEPRYGPHPPPPTGVAR
ncbi:uncharacterized protein [Panulirus ornatus]|uniref:uncharacterized protein isoform X2 n=1 Tax=Panulirus ornatus TaxID=150431 RepID=UPI003A88FA5E